MRVQIALLIVLGLLWAAPGEAACTGSSPAWTSTADHASVSTCVTSAANGDTINVGAGTFSWSSPITLPSTKDLNIIGATVVNCTGSPTNCTTTNNTNLTCSGAFCFVIELSRSHRISGFTMTVNGGVLTIGNQNSSKHFRLDHNRITGTDSFTQLWLPGGSNGIHAQGVVDHNWFTHTAVRPTGTTEQWDDSCPTCQHQLWAQPVVLGGGGSRVFIETNRFDHDGQGIQSSDSNYGGRYVYRFNNATSGFHNSEVHGMQGENRGSQMTEIYHNAFTAPSGSGTGGTTSFRGGTGVIFGNTQSFAYSYGVDFTIDRAEYDESTGNFESVRECGVGGPDGNSPAGVDQQTAGKNGWRCRDQVGTWYDVVQWAPFTAWNQVLAPVYVWLNTTGSSAMSITVNNQGDVQSKIFPNREFFCDAGHSGCANGVRAGTIATRPGTCTTGQAYWATNEGEWNSVDNGADGRLYKCTATNTWALYYTPYAYPHPWTTGGAGGGGGGGDLTPPSAPMNLRIQ